MKRAIGLTLLSVPLLVTWLPTTGQAASWEGAKVLPKSSSLQPASSPGGGERGRSYLAQWPATVRKTDGQWLQIFGSSESGAAADSWVRKDDVVRLDEAHTFSTKRIQEVEDQNGSARQAAEAHWLRAIYWEYAGETDSAIADYQQAAIAGEPLAADARLRLARALARRAGHLAMSREERLSTFDSAQENFEQAETAMKRSGGQGLPELYLAWGSAAQDRYRISGKIADAQDALEKFKQAASLRKSWSWPLHGQGCVLVALAGDKNPDAQKLLAAIQCFSEAIRVNPNCADAYRERADALVALSNTAGPYVTEEQRSFTAREVAFSGADPADVSSGQRVQRLAVLNEALDSAERAYLLGNNREPSSLETKAHVEAAIANLVYADDPPLRGKPVPTQLKGPIDQARSLYRRASDHASTAANYSQTLDEVDRRLHLAVDCHNRARQYAGYLAPASTAVASTASIREASAKLASASQQATQIEQNLAMESTELHATPLAAAIARHTESLQKVRNDAGDLQNRLNEAVAKPPAERRQDVETLRSRVEEASHTVQREQANLAEKLTAEPDPQKRKNLEAALDKNRELTQTLQQAADTLSEGSPEVSDAAAIDTAPVYTPLFLNR